MTSAENTCLGLDGSFLPVAGLVKSSLVDYPGYVSCILFVPGCNYNCFYCHNRPLVSGPYDLLPWDGVLDFLQKRKDQLDGVVITGGEPTLQKGLIPSIRAVRRLGYKVKLDTNGSSPEVVDELLKAGLCDYFAVDYKAPKDRYEEICGRGAKPVLQTIDLLKKSGVDFEARTTVIPQLTPEDLLLMAQELPSLPRYVLNPYRPPKVFLPEDEAKIAKKPYTAAEIAAFALAVGPFQPNVTA